MVLKLTENATVDEVIGKRLKILIVSRGFTQGHFAKMVGLTDSGLSRYIHGDRKMSPELIIKFCDVLGYSFAQLLTPERCKENKLSPAQAYQATLRMVQNNATEWSRAECLEIIKPLVMRGDRK